MQKLRGRVQYHDPLVSPMRTWAVWIAILVAIGWAISHGMQAFLLAHPKPTL